jgi:hypothetical protein
MKRCFPWSAPFSPQAPPKIALLCPLGPQRPAKPYESPVQQWSHLASQVLSFQFGCDYERSSFDPVRLVHRYYGAVRLLQSVRVCLMALGLRRPASFPFGPRRSRGLPVLVHVVSQRARGLRLRRTDCSLAFIANNRVAFLHQERVGILILRFSKLNTRPTDTPVYASSDVSRCHLQD